MTTHYLPDANEPALQPFTKTFVGMMFAHAAFEHRVSDLMEVITGVKGFGERSENQWKVDDRPKRMKRLIKEYRRGSLPETDAIADASSVRFHFAAPATCLHMGYGGGSTLSQTRSQFDLGSRGPTKISIERLKWPTYISLPHRSTRLR